jgi:hypothetical protein
VRNATKLGSTLVGLTVLVVLATPATADPEAPYDVVEDTTPRGVGGPLPPVARNPDAPREPGPGRWQTPADAEFARMPVEPGYLPGVAESFSRGADGEVLHTYDTGAGWSPWTPVGGRRVAGAPSGVYQPRTGSTEVFARDTDGRLVHADNRGADWSPWTALGDRRLAGDPLAVHQPNTGVTEVFARGQDGRLVHVDNSTGQWSAWTTIGDWTITGPLTSLRQPDTGTTEVTARTTDGRVLRVENAAGGWAIWSVS